MLEQEQEQAMPMENMPAKKSKLKLIILVVVILAIAGFGVYRVKFKLTPEQKQINENNQIIKSISKLMIIPGEQPIIATINQSDVLIKEQAFYNGSENGDKLVIFPKAQKAVIYSPKRNVIVNSGPFIINSGVTQQVPGK